MLLWFATSMSPSPEKSPADRPESEPSELVGREPVGNLDQLPGLDPVQRLLAPLVEVFTANSFHLYLVGGVVRDLLNGDYGSTSDLDLTTDAEPEHIKRLVKPLAKAVWTQGERFGTIGVQIADGDSPSGVREVEITTHRAEQYSPESRKPEVVFGTNLREDLSRRDFTVNAMAIELVGVDADEGTGRAELRDPFNGLEDLRRQVLRTPLGPEISFEDDPLRMMRAARFIARLNLHPVAELESAAAQMADRLAIVSVERIADELERLLAVANPATGLAFLQRTDLLAQVLAVPYDVDMALSLASVAARAEVRRAGLLYAVADPTSVMSRLRYSNDDRRSTAAVITAMRTWLASAQDLEATRRAVNTVTSAKSTYENLAGLAHILAATDVDSGGHAILALLDELAVADDLGPYVGPLSGPEIMQVLGVEPGPVVGRAQKLLVDKRLESGPLDPEAARQLLADHHEQLIGY